jgi:hypothetical protein
MTLEGCFRGRLPRQCKDSRIDSRYDTRTGVSVWIPLCIVWGPFASLCSLWGNDFSSFDVFGSWGGAKCTVSPWCVTHSGWEDSSRGVCDHKRAWNLCYCNDNTHPLTGTVCNFRLRLECGTSHGICPGTTRLVMGSLHGETFWVCCGWLSFGKTRWGRGNARFRVTEGIVTVRFILCVMYCNSDFVICYVLLYIIYWSVEVSLHSWFENITKGVPRPRNVVDRDSLCHGCGFDNGFRQRG